MSPRSHRLGEGGHPADTRWTWWFVVPYVRSPDEAPPAPPDPSVAHLPSRQPDAVAKPWGFFSAEGVFGQCWSAVIPWLLLSEGIFPIPDHRVGTPPFSGAAPGSPHPPPHTASSLQNVILLISGILAPTGSCILRAATRHCSRGGLCSHIPPLPPGCGERDRGWTRPRAPWAGFARHRDHRGRDGLGHACPATGTLGRECSGNDPSSAMTRGQPRAPLDFCLIFLTPSANNKDISYAELLSRVFLRLVAWPRQSPPICLPLQGLPCITLGSGHSRFWLHRCPQSPAGAADPAMLWGEGYLRG